MEKSKHYHETRFSPSTLQAAFDLMKSLGEKQELYSQNLDIEFESETWNHDSIPEFYSDLRKNPKHAIFSVVFQNPRRSLRIRSQEYCSDVTISHPNRGDVEKVFNLLESVLTESKKPRPDEESKSPVIFIGHGRNTQWRDLKDHLHERHGYIIEAFEIGARFGHTIRDILDSMLAKSSFAILLLTAEDETVDGTMHARENVIHELGLFQGKLGFSKSLILLENSTSEFSNIHGILQIRFADGNIKETYGDILATLKREFPDA